MVARVVCPTVTSYHDPFGTAVDAFLMRVDIVFFIRDRSTLSIGLGQNLAPISTIIVELSPTLEAFGWSSPISNALQYACGLLGDTGCPTPKSQYATEEAPAESCGGGAETCSDARSDD